MKENRIRMAASKPAHFSWRAEGKVGVVTIDRPEKKNPLTVDSYAELRDFFRKLQAAEDIQAIGLTGIALETGPANIGATLHTPKGAVMLHSQGA